MITEKILTVEKCNSGWVLTLHQAATYFNEDGPKEFSDAYGCSDHIELVERIAGLIDCDHIFKNYKLVPISELMELRKRPPL
jgi:hypothetical protein